MDPFQTKFHNFYQKNVVLDQVLVQDLVQDQESDILWIKIMEFGLKWVHMARYELILKQDGALWLRIILELLLTQKGLCKTKESKKV